MPGFCIAGDLYSKPRKSLCDRIHLTFTTASRCLHSLRSVDMTAFAAFATLVCQKNSVFLCKGTKLKNSARQNSWTVCRFSLWNSARCFRIQRKLNSGLWLGAFGKKRIFMCQSTFAFRFCLRNCVFLCKGTKAAKSCAFCVIRRSRILG